jgi:uncharacterized lipoprotein YehR (DUF1307 family)
MENRKMKRSFVVLVTLVVALALAACAVTTPGTSGVVTKVEGNTVTVANAGTETAYTITNSTSVYAPDGVLTQRSYLSAGQRVMVWANGTNNTVVRINVEP